MSVCAINGALWHQDQIGNVYSYDVPRSLATENYTMRIQTGAMRPGEAPLSWGRVRGVGVNGKVIADHNLTIRVRADDRSAVVASKVVAQSTAAAPANWPGKAPEVRTTMQRCTYITVELSASPAAAEWNTIDVWASASDERAPSRNRS